MSPYENGDKSPYFCNDKVTAPLKHGEWAEDNPDGIQISVTIKLQLH